MDRLISDDERQALGLPLPSARSAPIIRIPFSPPRPVDSPWDKHGSVSFVWRIFRREKMSDGAWVWFEEMP